MNTYVYIYLHIYLYRYMYKCICPYIYINMYWVINDGSVQFFVRLTRETSISISIYLPTYLSFCRYISEPIHNIVLLLGFCAKSMLIFAHPPFV